MFIHSITRRGIGFGLVAGLLATGIAVPAEATFIKASAAAQRVSRLPGVNKARTVGTTKRFYKVTSESAQDARLRYVSRNGRISATSRNLVPRAKQLVALDAGRGGKQGGNTEKASGFTVRAGSPLLTDSGKNVRIWAVRESVNARWAPEGYLVNITNGLRKGSPTRIQADPSDGMSTVR